MGCVLFFCLFSSSAFHQMILPLPAPILAARNVLGPVMLMPKETKGTSPISIIRRILRRRRHSGISGEVWMKRPLTLASLCCEDDPKYNYKGCIPELPDTGAKGCNRTPCATYPGASRLGISHSSKTGLEKEYRGAEPATWQALGLVFTGIRQSVVSPHHGL